MSSQQRRDELRKQFEAKCEARDAEERRKNALSMYERIEESDASRDVKDILSRIADHLGILYT